MRRTLDTLYRTSLWASALCLVAIALMVGVQLAARLIDGTLSLLHLPRTDFVILSLDEIGGYLLAAASFFALGGTLKAGAHDVCGRRTCGGFSRTGALVAVDDA